jgi:DNA-binding transcriptional LysR family regulator
MESYFTQARFQPRFTMELKSNDAIKQAVKANLGLSFLSLHTIGLELQTNHLCILDVRGTPMVRAWHVVHAMSKLLSPAAEAFRYFVLEHAETDLAAQFGELRQPRT